MIRKVISKYGLAAHLGLLAAFPVISAPFLPLEVVGHATLWLSLFAALWCWAEPSVRAGEHSSDARLRVLLSVIKDPLLYFFLFVCCFALVRWLNSGIALCYDSEQAQWLVKEPVADVFPASAGDSGFIPFTVAVSFTVVFMGARHALGLQARLFCGITTVSLAGVSGLVAAVFACLGRDPVLVKHAMADFSSAPFMGSSYGFFLILAIVFGMDAEARKWGGARVPFTLAVGGCSAGLVLFAPPLLVALHLLVALIYLVFASFYCARSGTMGGLARGICLVLLGFAVPALLLMGLASPELQAAKLRGLDIEFLFPVEYKTLYETLSRIAKGIWMERPWLGAGVGGFGLHAPFLAEKVDWSVLPPHPQAALNGYWMVLTERGIIGCAVLAVGGVLLLGSWGVRGLEAFRYLHNNDDADIFPFACPPVVWTAPALVLLAAAELLISPAITTSSWLFCFAVSLALAAASFPRDPKTSTPESTSPSPNQGK